ncbi:MAG TPA: 3-oxoacyl-ACP reductase FabG [Actinomycetota bacterium]|nr:3-oxoacyl-ACP reductase FabG [Actinomycetota bacterium]
MSARVALVTGASGGIGRATARALAADGLTVACGFHSDDAGAKETVGLIEEEGGTASSFGADVADEADVKQMFDDITEWSGPPMVLVNNAGVNRDGLTIKYPRADFERILEVNVTGSFLCSRAALSGMMRARWGRIVMVSSVLGLRGNAGQAAYSASKTALLGLTRSLAREYGSRGITVNAVCPGYIETDMTASLPEKARERLLSEIPTGRLGSLEEVAAAIGFLVSERASYVNGAVLAIDGGMTA